MPEQLDILVEDPKALDPTAPEQFPLFTAPQTLRGQLAMPDNERVREP